jgi:hypothetical protein
MEQQQQQSQEQQHYNNSGAKVSEEKEREVKVSVARRLDFKDYTKDEKDPFYIPPPVLPRNFRGDSNQFVLVICESKDGNVHVLRSSQSHMEIPEEAMRMIVGLDTINITEINIRTDCKFNILQYPYAVEIILSSPDYLPSILESISTHQPNRKICIKVEGDGRTMVRIPKNVTCRYVELRLSECVFPPDDTTFHSIARSVGELFIDGYCTFDEKAPTLVEFTPLLFPPHWGYLKTLIVKCYFPPTYSNATAPFLKELGIITSWFTSDMLDAHTLEKLAVIASTVIINCHTYFPRLRWLSVNFDVSDIIVQNIDVSDITDNVETIMVAIRGNHPGENRLACNASHVRIRPGGEFPPAICDGATRDRHLTAPLDSILAHALDMSQLFTDNGDHKENGLQRFRKATLHNSNYDHFLANAAVIWNLCFEELNLIFNDVQLIGFNIRDIHNLNILLEYLKFSQHIEPGSSVTFYISVLDLFIDLQNGYDTTGDNAVARFFEDINNEEKLGRFVRPVLNNIDQNSYALDPDNCELELNQLTIILNDIFNHMGWSTISRQHEVKNCPDNPYIQPRPLDVTVSCHGPIEYLNPRFRNIDQDELLEVVVTVR